MAVLVLTVLASPSCVLVTAQMGPKVPQLAETVLHPHLVVDALPLAADAKRVKSVNHSDVWIATPYPIDVIKDCRLFTRENVHLAEDLSDLSIRPQLLGVVDIGCENNEAGRYDISVGMHFTVTDNVTGKTILDKTYPFEAHEEVVACGFFEWKLPKETRRLVESDKGFSPNRAYEAIYTAFLNDLAGELAKPYWREREANNARVAAAVKQATTPILANNIEETARILGDAGDVTNVNPNHRVNALGFATYVALMRKDYPLLARYAAAGEALVGVQEQRLSPLSIVWFDLQVSSNVLLGALEQKDESKIEALEKRRRAWWDNIRPKVRPAGVGTEFVGLTGDDRQPHVDPVAYGFSSAWAELALLAVRRGDADAARAYVKEAKSVTASFTPNSPYREYATLTVDFAAALAEANGDLGSAAGAAIQRAGRYPSAKATFERYVTALAR